MKKIYKIFTVLFIPLLYTCSSQDVPTDEAKLYLNSTPPGDVAGLLHFAKFNGRKKRGVQTDAPFYISLPGK